MSSQPGSIEYDVRRRRPRGRRRILPWRERIGGDPQGLVGPPVIAWNEEKITIELPRSTECLLRRSQGSRSINSK
jgi:hypothetical protein